MKDLLLGLAERSAVINGGAFPIAGRTRWQATVRVASLTAGASVQVVLEVSPTAADGSWVTVLDFGSLNTVGSTTKDSRTTTSEWDAQITDRDVWLRARVAAITGKVVFDVTAESPWLDPNYAPHSDWLSNDLRTYGNLRAILRTAEADLLAIVLDTERGRFNGAAVDHAPPIVDFSTPAVAELLSETPTGQVWVADPTLPGFGETMQALMAEQAEHLYTREKLRRGTTPAALVTWRETPRMAPGITDRLRRFIPTGLTVWRGR